MPAEAPHDADPGLGFQDSDLLRFRAWPENQNSMVNVTTAFTYSFCGEKSLGQACQASLMWTKLSQQSCSYILFSSISYMYREQTSVWAKTTLISVCWHPIKFECTRHKHLCDSYWCGSGCWLELTARCSLPGKAIACYLEWELIVLTAARSSFAPWTVPENRCVMCHILNRWTCHMRLTVVIQLSLTLWVNSSSLLHQSLNRQKKC